MAGRIPQSFINELVARTDVVDIIDRRVTLKKSGHNYTACCPFHNEKTPSFSVNPDKQFYYCFGCGASGNALTFLMEYEGQEFVAAIEDLAAQLGMEIPKEAYSEEPQRQHEYHDLFPLMESVSQYYQQQLKSHPNAEKAINYLKNRGLSGEIAKQYGIGFAPDEWQNLTTLKNQSENLQKDLIETGMMLKNEKGHTYDRFRDRIMFPIRNRRGQVLGFGGRVIDQGEPKYLNSPETSLFHKGKELYGIYEMRRQLRNIEHVIIVEGYMDVVALAQFEIYNATATLGTATTSDHLQTLFRLCKKIVFCFDGDKAGKAAALRALKHALPMVRDTREVRIMFLPDGEDPDSLVRKIGKDAFEERVESAITLFDYLINHLKFQVDMDTFEGPARMVHLAKPYFQEITDPVLSARFLSRLSQMAGLSEAQLNEVLQKDNANRTTPEKRQAEYRQPAETRADNPVSEKSSDNTNNNQSKNKIPFRRAISLLLQYPDAFPAANTSWLKSITEPGAIILYEMLELTRENEGMTTAMLIENWRGRPEEPHLNKLAITELHIKENNANSELCDIIKRLERTYVIDQCDTLINKTKKQPLSQEEKETLKRLLQASQNG